MKKRNLLPIVSLLAVTLVSGCSNECSTFTSDCPVTSIIGEITDKNNVIALPNQAVNVQLNNANNEEISLKVGDSNICKVAIINNRQIEITTLSEGKTTVEVKAGSYKSKIDVECLNLDINNEENHVDVGNTITLSLTKDVDAEISIDNQEIASLEGKTIKGLKEGTFNVTVKYGDIIIKKAFDTYQYKNTIDELNRNNPFIHYLGRNYHAYGEVKMDNEGSGFEVYFKGTSLKATLSGKFGSWYGNTMISVLVDDEIDTTKRVITLSKGAKNYEYTLVENLTNDFHRVKVLKRTENLSTYMTLTKVTTDGKFYPVQNEDKLKIEVYGDSISAGYGNLREDLTDTTSAKYQSGLQTYAAYTAFALDAEINIQARSGIGMYTANNSIGDGNHVKDHFDKVNYDGINHWNFDNYTPDIVLINLGTNDYWDASHFNESSYISYYIQTVKSLSEAYGSETSFILLSGLMEQEVNTFVVKVKNQLLTQIPNKVFSLQFNKCEEGHPKYTEHALASDQLVKLIKENNLNVIHKHSEESSIPVSKGEDVKSSFNVKLQDELPENTTLWANLPNNEKVQMTKIDSFTYNASINMKEGDYEVYFTLNNDENFSEANNVKHTLHIRKDYIDSITLDTFLSMPEKEDDSQFGWTMTDHLNAGEFTATDSANVTVKNENWLAGFVVKDTELEDNYTLSATIKADNEITDYANAFAGFVVYYASATDYVVVYLQWNADGSIRGIGCTGMLEGADIGWNDFFSISGTYVMTDGVDFKVSRNGTTLKVELGDQSESQDIAKMSGATEKVGIYAEYSGTSFTYNNFAQVAHEKEVSNVWTYSSHLNEGTMTENNDGTITLYNSNNWLAGYAIKETGLSDNYYVSATLKCDVDAYTSSDDVVIGLVPFYINDKNFVAVYLQWDANKLIKSLGCTGIIGGNDIGWNDMWGFANISTSLVAGQTLKVTRSNKQLTCEFANITGSVTLSSLDGMANKYIGLYSNKTTTTFSNIQFESK